MHRLAGVLNKHSDALLWSVVTICLIVGTIYSIMLGDGIRYHDEREYNAIAKNLAATTAYSLDGHVPTAIRPPLYPLSLAIMLKGGANIFILRIANYFFLAATIFLVYKLILRTGGRGLERRSLLYDCTKPSIS